MFRLLFLLAFCACTVAGWDNGLARTPPLGYSTWNFFPRVAINETTCYEQVDAIVETGLRDLGYTVFVVDEPCFVGRNTNGSLIENATTWPRGLKAFGDYLHARGMKLGIYTDQGPLTCGRCVASEGHEMQDMAQFAAMGADYIKVDSCNRDVEPEHWAVFRDAINATERPMVFSIIAQGQKESWTWGNATGNLWRTTHDIMNSFGGFTSNLDAQESVADIDKYAGPGAWNDPDMLIVGTRTNHGGSGITVAEARAHFSLWSVLKSPLLISADMTMIDPDFLDILKNEEVLAVNQDNLGVQAKKIRGPSLGLTLSPCQSGNEFQMWAMNRSGAVVNSKANQCLSVYGCSTRAGAAAIMFECFPSGNSCNYKNQLWHFDTSTGRLIANISSLCLSWDLDQVNCSTSDDASWSYVDNQLIAGNDTSKCLTLPGETSQGEIYAGPLEWGAFAAVLFNRETKGMNMTLSFTDIGLTNETQCGVRDLWMRKDLGIFTGSISLEVDPHDVRMITLMP